MSKKNNVYVIGHKNPDTDSICSAISYAYLKNELSQKQEEGAKYIPTRAGHINEETQYVLKYFEQEAPLYVNDIRPQVTDIEIRKTAGIDSGLSLKKAWDIMRGARIVSLPILENEKLAGIITVSDIAYSDMDVYDNMILSKAGTSYSNIVETIDEEVKLKFILRIFEVLLKNSLAFIPLMKILKFIVLPIIKKYQLLLET